MSSQQHTPTHRVHKTGSSPTFCTPQSPFCRQSSRLAVPNGLDSQPPPQLQTPHTSQRQQLQTAFDTRSDGEQQERTRVEKRASARSDSVPLPFFSRSHPASHPCMSLDRDLFPVSQPPPPSGLRSALMLCNHAPSHTASSKKPAPVRRLCLTEETEEHGAGRQDYHVSYSVSYRASERHRTQ